MYPQLSAPLCRDGKIFAVPYSVQVQSLGYYPKGFEAVGLTEEDVPRNMREMLAFMKRWDAEFAEEYPDVKLFDAPDQPAQSAVPDDLRHADRPVRIAGGDRDLS